MKIALVSTGLGRVLRGFESLTESLFQALRNQAPYLDVTLFQGGGRPGNRRIVVPNLNCHDVTAHWFDYESNRYCIVHYNEFLKEAVLFEVQG